MNFQVYTQTENNFTTAEKPFEVRKAFIYLIV